MVYLENKTELQELWIPRNDGQGVPYNPTKELEGVEVTISEDITVVHPSSGYYGMSAVTIDATEYGQQNYDSGFDDGYIDGYASGSTEGYESGYTSGSTDGYNSGYTSGETHQKSLLVSTAFTENGEYQRENGYSAITVNVPTGQTYNIEENKPFVVNRNGNYTIKPSSGITTINDHFDSDDDCYYITATTSGYPLTGRYNLFYIEDEFDSSKGQIDVYIENGYLDYNDIGWDGGKIVDWDTGDRLVLEIRDANNGFGWMRDDDFYYHYDLMSAVSLTVQPIKYVEYIETDGSQIIFDTGVKVGSDDSSFEVDIDFMPLSKNNVNTFLSDEYDEFNILFRVWGDEYQTALGNLANNANISVNNRYDVTFSYASYKGNVKCNGVDVIPMQSARLYRNSLVHSLYLNYGIAGNCPSARYYKLKITKNGVEHLFRPCLDLNNVPCFYDEYNGVYLYKTGRGTPTAGPLLPSEEYQSGYTDGQNNIINTFTSTTVSANGVYGSSAHPLSSITVNVPQTGGSGVKYIEYLETDGTNIVYDTGINITSNNVKIYLDYMRLSGSTENYLNIVSQVYNDRKFSYAFFVPGNWNTRGGVMPRFGGENYEIPSLLDTYYETVVSNTGTTINGVDYPFSFTSFQETDEHMYLNAQHYYGNFRRFAIARYYRFAVESGGTLLVDLRPALDENNIPCFYDEVSETYIYHTGSGTPIAGPVLDPSYASGYTDGQNSIISTFTAATATTNGIYGSSANPYSSITVNVPQTGHTDQELQDAYNSGYTSGSTDVISTFSSTTATTNGVYGSSEHPLSSITVNVPQTGGSGVKYVEYIETDGTYIGFDFSTAHTYSSLDETICLDFMPLNGTVYSDTYYGFMGAENMLLWTIPYGYRVNDKYGLSIGDFNMYYGWSSGPTFSAGTRFDCAFSSTGATINNVDYPFTITSVNTPGYIRLNWNGDINNPRCPVARYYGFKIMSGDTVICNYRPAIDNNGIPCFYEETTGEYYYKNPICSGTPIAGPVLPSPDYQSGYTDGYNEAISDVIDSAETLTVSANGSYATSLIADGHLWNEVVVNVDTATTYNSGYTDGYNSGTTDGYNSGTTDGYNSGYTDGFNSGYTSGVTDGENNIVSTFSSMTATTNGVYGSSANPLSSITVNVPQTAYTYDVIPMIDGTATSIDIPYGCTEIRPHCFSPLNYLTAVTIPNTVVKIGHQAFYNDIRLKSVAIPDSVTIIDEGAFENCREMTAFTFSNNLETIGANAFASCTGLTVDLVIPDSVTDIGSYAFSRAGCNNVTIGSGITYLLNAFLFMENLKTVRLGENITTISDIAFSGDTSLTTIYSYPTTAPTLDYGSRFIGMPSTGTVHYPVGSDYSIWRNQYLIGWTFIGDL